MKRYGLFIGINDYPETSGLHPLRYAEEDAKTLARTFEQLFGFTTDLLLGEEATYLNIDDALNDCGKGDLFVFFFAGHGADEDGRHLLYPFDARVSGRRTLRFKNILNDWQGGFGYGKVLAMFDACRNVFNHGEGARGHGGLGNIVSRDIEETRKPGSTRVDIIYGCREGQFSFEEEELGHGLFTHGLLDTLHNYPGRIDGHTLSGHTGDVMRDWCDASPENRRQECWFYGPSSLREQIVLREQPEPERVHMAQRQVKIIPCPICGKMNSELDTFVCRECGTGNLCLSHQDPATFTCLRCVTKALADQRAQEQHLQEVARIEQEQRERERLEGKGLLGKHWTEPVTGMEFVWIPGGIFEMGDIWGDGEDYEKPVHTVTVPGFYMGKYPVTQAEYEQVMGENPSEFNHGPRYPVECVSWEDVQEFLEKLQQISGKRFVLPSEAMWEYAARGGRDDKWSGTGDKSCLRDYACIKKKATSPVDTRWPNAFGLHDMTGNVSEWCEDLWHDDYSGAPADGSIWCQGSDTYRVIRGGCWSNPPKLARSARREGYSPDSRHEDIGFRLCLPNQQE